MTGKIQTFGLYLWIVGHALTFGQDTPPPLDIMSNAVARIVGLFEPGTNPQTFSATLTVRAAEGLPKAMAGKSLQVAFQAPDKVQLSAEAEGARYQLGRCEQTLWLNAPDKHFGLVGVTNVPRFSATPEKKDNSCMGPIRLPVPKEQIAMVPLLMKLELQPGERVDDQACYVMQALPYPQAIQLLKLPKGQWRFWIRQQDFFPVRIAYEEGEKIRVQVDIQHIKMESAWPVQRWQLAKTEEDVIETVALSHVTRFLRVALRSLDRTIPTLGPATGERRLIATEGQGKLELIDGTRVLFLKGTPEEMGRQHGVLLKKQVHELVDQILYGVGVGSSFAKGRWFLGEIEAAQKRLSPNMEARYVREMDALADAAGLEHEEIRLANYFPELFHCSGFALFGKATKDGKMYHGRILDYLRGMGLEQNAVVMVFQPDQGNTWVNISYAGFIGSVTAMNAKHVAIGEMGGRGEGQWDGKPMAQLMREVAEKANTLEEAVDIMRRGPRTCEYYYVISDSKTKRAVGIAATPNLFETIWPGRSNPRLPHAFEDAVLMSAGDRYETLSGRVKEKHGQFDADSARDLMTRPVCMNSNIHSVLFANDTLDFWVANADSKNVASHTRYTRYNLEDLLKPTQ